MKWTSSRWSLGALQVKPGAFVPCTVWAWAQWRWLAWRLQLSFPHFEGVDAALYLMGMWQGFIFCSCKQYVPLILTAGIQRVGLWNCPPQFPQLCSVQSFAVAGHLPQPASQEKGSLKGAQRLCAGCSLWLSSSPEITWGIFAYMSIWTLPHAKDRGVISDQQQEMEANVLTPKTFYSFCLVLHLPPRAAAFISPFEWPTGLHSPEEQRKCLFSWNPWKTTKDFSSCSAISHHFQQ